MTTLISWILVLVVQLQTSSLLGNTVPRPRWTETNELSSVKYGLLNSSSRAWNHDIPILPEIISNFLDIRRSLARVLLVFILSFCSGLNMTSPLSVLFLLFGVWDVFIKFISFSSEVSGLSLTGLVSLLMGLSDRDL